MKAGVFRGWGGRGRALAALPTLFLAAAGAGSAAPAPVQVRADLPYLAPGRQERLDLYLPASAPPGRPLPAVVYFHGGGWVKGDKNGARDRSIARSLADAGYAVASADYRIGDGSWPINREDCLNAVRFVRSHASEYGIDPRRIAVMGASAGGHLALLVGFARDSEARASSGPYPGVSASVRAVVELYGITDLLTRKRATADGRPTGLWEDSHASEMLGREPGRDRAVWAEASPVNHVDSSCPPVLIVHGLADATVDYPQAEELADSLKAHGVEHELILLAGVGHMFDLEMWKGRPLPVDVRSAVVAFLARHLAVDGRP